MGAVRCGMLALVVAGACGMVRADRIYLRNGRHLDGLIENESGDKIILQVEGGRIKVARDRIRDILYSRPDDARRIEQDWKRKYYLNEAYVPFGMRDIADRVRAVRDERHAAVAALARLDGCAQTERTLRDERAALAVELAAAGDKLRGMSPTRDVAAYNRLVTEINDLQRLLSLKTDALRELPEERDGWRDRIARYENAVATVRTDVARLHGGGGERSDETRLFLDRLMNEVTRLAGEFRTASTPMGDDRHGRSVRVSINGRQHGRFVVDTGAAVVTLSREFAEAIGLEWDDRDANRVELVLANGEKEEGCAVVLDSVSVNGIQSCGVPAVVLKTAPGEGVDGLLGMSFLGRFHLRMAPGARHLSITEFAPGE